MAVLTAEGMLVVRDVYVAGKEVDGFQAGPCWLLRPEGTWPSKTPGRGPFVHKPLAHKASHEGELVAELIHGKNRVNDVRTIPNVVFTEPEIASAGLGEQEAKDAGHEINVGKFPFAASGRAMAIQETTGFVKVITDVTDNRVLGIHIVGPEASDLISEGSLAIEMGAFVAPDAPSGPMRSLPPLAQPATMAAYAASLKDLTAINKLREEEREATRNRK